MSVYDQYRADMVRARASIAGHVAAERRSRGFDFRTEGRFAYAYSLTWTPGSLFLAGDCGELQVVHYQALAQLEEGLRWAAGSDYDYLLSKTKLRRTYDPEATAREIIRMANEAAGESLKNLRAELREWRSSKEEYGDALDDWRADRPTVGEFREEERWSLRERRYFIHRSPPDGWELWGRLQDELVVTPAVKAILRASHRAALRDALDEFCTSHDRGEVIDLIQRLRISDYYGEERWTFHNLLQVVCVQEGARRALALIEEAQPAPAVAA